MGSLSKKNVDEKNKAKEFFEGLFVALIAALVIRQFIIGSYHVPTSSMEKTILVGDFLLVNKFVYGMRTPDWIGIPYTNTGFFVPWFRFPSFEDPEPGDVVVFRYPLDQTLDYIKRCVAKGDQVLEVRDKEVFVDSVQFPHTPGLTFSDPRIWQHNEGRYYFPTFNRQKYGSRDNFGPLKIPADHYFMMGDNRDNSSDSRQWGFVPHDNVVGKASIIYFSWDGSKPWSRFFELIRISRMGDIIR